jgi:multiple sugar transport system ATP-binding protein
MTVYENIAFGLKPHNKTDDEVKELVDKAAEMLHLQNIYARKPRETSGGQRQRIALARALVVGHNVILLDEPFSNVDAAFRAYMKIEMKKLHKRFNTSFVYVTHDQNDAMSIADRIVNEGRVHPAG